MAFTAEQASRCKEVFQKFDTNSDGVIDFGELKDGLKELGEFSEEDVAEIMDEADVDKNGVIDEKEFGRFAHEVFVKKEIAKEETIHHYFKKYDVDNDDLIGPDELFCITQDLSYNDISMEDAEKIIQVLDANNDGKISFQELNSFLCK